MRGYLEEIAIDTNEKEVIEEVGYKTSTVDNNTSTNNQEETDGTTTTTNDNTSTNSQGNPSDSFNVGITKANTLTAALNNIQTNFASLLVGGEEERIFYDRKVRPLIDEVYFLSVAAQGVSIAAQNLQGNAFAKKREIKLSVDLTYDIIKEAYCVLDVLRERNCLYRSIVESDLERCGGNPINYSMNNNTYEDSSSYEDNINCDED